MTTTFSRVLRSRRPVLAAAVFASILLLSCQDGSSAGNGAAGKPPAPGTKVDFQLPSVDGRKLRTLASGVRDAGVYPILWDGRDEQGNGVSTGVFYVRFLAGNVRQTRAITFMR